MKLKLIATVHALVLGLTLLPAHAMPFKLYLTASTGTIKQSDDGITWTDYVTGYGSQRLRGITTDSNGNVIFINRDGGTSNADRPIYAYTPAGNLITSTTADINGLFNLTPLGYFGGYVYLSSGGNGIEDSSSSWDGSVFGSNPFAAALDSNWQGNDMVFASSGGTDYQFINGTSGVQLRRRTVVGDGTLASQTAVTFTPAAGSLPQNWTDLAFSASGRIILLGQGTTAANGIWVSDPGVIDSTSITVTQVFAFSATTETPDTGDMGPNARDMVLIGTNIFAVSNERCYKYVFDDTLGTVTYVTNSLHGFSTDQVQLAFYVPEPAVIGLGLVVGMLAVRKRG